MLLTWLTKRTPLGSRTLSIGLSPSSNAILVTVTLNPNTFAGASTSTLGESAKGLGREGGGGEREEGGTEG